MEEKESLQWRLAGTVSAELRFASQYVLLYNENEVSVLISEQFSESEARRKLCALGTDDIKVGKSTVWLYGTSRFYLERK